ncbi:hypothetical protein L1887_03010 [Cichorium endivia]|nr:hypothetical protein L1887_03010 [Cichorium endivia]
MKTTLTQFMKGTIAITVVGSSRDVCIIKANASFKYTTLKTPVYYCKPNGHFLPSRLPPLPIPCSTSSPTRDLNPIYTPVHHRSTIIICINFNHQSLSSSSTFSYLEINHVRINDFGYLKVNTRHASKLANTPLVPP